MKTFTLEFVIFTDLDGTLLDRTTYSYAKALPTITHLLEKKAPIVFCSAKTRVEQEWYQEKLRIRAPFIVENGGAIFIPKDYFPFSFCFDKTEGTYHVIELGIPYHTIRQILAVIKAGIGLNFQGYGDISVEEVASKTGLDIEGARRARDREYSETLLIDEIPGETQKILSAIKEAGLNYTHGGSYYSVIGDNDKGKAVTILQKLFCKKLGKIRTIGIGDSLNDLPMLSVVDLPLLLMNSKGSWEEMKIPNLRKVEGSGPEGWASAIREITGN